MNNTLKKRLISIVLIMVIVLPNSIIASASDDYNKGYVAICNVGDGDYVSYEAIEVDEELFVAADDIATIINMEIENCVDSIFYYDYYNNRTIDVWYDGTIWTRGITYEAKVYEVDNQFYLPLEKMLYLSNAQWCVQDGVVYVQLTENTILDFIDAYCMEILDNNITQTELLMNGESEWSNATKSAFASIFNDFDVRVFVPIWGAVTLTVEDYQNAMLQLAKDELEFIDEYGQSHLDNLLIDSGFSEVKSIWDDAQSVADLPEDILTATDYVNKTYLWIKDTKNGTKMFSEYNDLADFTPAEISAVSTKLQGVSDVLTVANAIVNVNEIATRSKSWNEDFLAQIELLTDFDETGYDKTMVNYIKKASSGLLEEHTDTFSATTDACVEESLKVLGEKLVDLTPASTLTSIITTGLSVAKLLDDDFATSFDALELSNMVEWLIRIEHVAFTEMARDIQTVRTKSISGESSLEELTELRNITMLSLRTNLRNKVFIYYLNTVRNNDASWINSEEAKAIEQDILWNYGKIIELSESEQLDKLLILDDFENMYSDEYGCKRDRIDSDILSDEKLYDNDLTLSPLYAKIIEQYITSFPWDSTTIADVTGFMGASYLYYYHSKLAEIGYVQIDIDQNGQKELLIGEIGKNTIYDLYTIKNGEVIHLGGSGERFFYMLCSDGSVIYNWSGSAFESGDDRCLINSTGDALELDKRVTYDAYYAEEIGLINNAIEANADECYFVSESEDNNDYKHISAKQAREITDTFYEHMVESIDFIPFSEYNLTQGVEDEEEDLKSSEVDQFDFRSTGWGNQATISAYAKSENIIRQYDTPQYEPIESPRVSELGRKDEKYYLVQDGRIFTQFLMTENIA